MKGNLKTAKGITLIALVITIIVLLILAGVSIAMLTGQNGILTQANNAKIEQSHGTIRDSISLAYNEWQIELNTASTTKLASTEVVQIQGKEEHSFAVETDFLVWLVSKGYASSDGVINVEALTGAKQSLGNGSGTDDVYKLEQENGSYIVKYYASATEVEEIWNTSASSGTGSSEPNWDEILEDANSNPEDYKHPRQIVSEEIGIGTDGEPTNMDNWGFTYDETTNSYKPTPVGDYGKPYQYSGDYTDDGKIVGKIPQYIYNENSGKFEAVTSIKGIFVEDTNLIIAPEIPSTVTDMSETFRGCENLEKVPSIPENLENMQSTFKLCVSLKEVAELPNSVTNMNGTFWECESLEVVPKIPNNITSLEDTFLNCSALTGELVINASNVTSYSGCLDGAATNDNCKLVLSGSCPQLQGIYETANGNPNVTLVQ